MRTLTLSLKKKWYDMIASGEKKEEYREVTEYWNKRLCVLLADHVDRFFRIKHFDAVTFTLGYPKKDDMSRRMSFKINGITIGCGNTEWGAEPNKKYFVIKLGERIRQTKQTKK